MGQGLLAIDILSSFDRFHRGKSMMVVRSCNDHGIDFLHLFQHFPIIGELPGFGIFREDAAGVMFVHIAERDNVFAFHLGQIVSALAAKADAGDIQSAAGRSGTAQAEHGAGKDHKTSRGKSGAAQELTASELGLGDFCFMLHRTRGIHAKMSFTTWPSTSVRRKRRPWYRYESRS